MTPLAFLQKLEQIKAVAFSISAELEGLPFKTSTHPLPFTCLTIKHVGKYSSCFQLPIKELIFLITHQHRKSRKHPQIASCFRSSSITNSSKHLVMAENKSLAFSKMASNKSRPTSHWIQMKRPENSSQKVEAFKSGAFCRRRMKKLLEQRCMNLLGVRWKCLKAVIDQRQSHQTLNLECQ